MQTYRGSFEVWINANEKIRKVEHAEDITKYADGLDEGTDYNLYDLNKEMDYDTEIIADTGKKLTTVNEKN
jgi:hypothetical protein